MTSIEEPPLPTDGPWAVAATVRLGVIGSRGIASRLRGHVGVVAVGPRDDAWEIYREIDALLVELSAFEDLTGSWAHALRPGGFDRGQALARLLRLARVLDRPVLAVDDRRVGSRDPWQGILEAAVDDVAPLGPVTGGGIAWNPGLHWASGVLGLRPEPDRVAGSAVGGNGPTGGGVAGVPDVGARGWVEGQRTAVVDGCVAVDVDDPWQAHLGDELALLGVDVVRRDGSGSESQRSSSTAARGATLPREAVTALCRRLGLPVPKLPTRIVVSAHSPNDFERRELDAAFGRGWRHHRYDALGSAIVDVDAQDVVLLASPDGPLHGPAASEADGALDRAVDAEAVAVVDGVVVGVRGRLLHRWAREGGNVHARALDTAVWA